MENETFQNLNLSHLDFSQTPEPQKLDPQPHLMSRMASGQTQEAIGAKQSHSIHSVPTGATSFQTLMAQNEDLVAQLRVTLHRLSALEQLNQQLQENFDAARTQSSAVFDQLLIWKEKSKIWKEKELNLERIHKNETRNFTIEIDLLKQKVMQLEKCQDDLARYQKYHEKVKTSVKPYIQKLKDYTKSLFEQTQSLNSQLIEKDLKITVIESDFKQLQETSFKREEIFLAQKNELIAMFEQERTALKNELMHLQNSNEVLVEKTRSLDRSLERQDELENLIVALRRNKEEALKSRETEIVELKAQNSNLNQKATTLELRNLDLTRDLDLKDSQLKKTEGNLKENEEQLSSLRYLWTQKSQENEKLKLTQAGLEKINLELSQKLKDLRNKEC